MDLPPALILDSLSEFSIIFFKDTEHEKDAPPHFYVAFQINQVLRFSIIIITSQIERRRKYYRTNAKALSALVPIHKGTVSFLPKESILDCNRMEIFSKGEFLKRIHPDVPLQLKAREIPADLVKEILSGIDRSPMISPAIKQKVREAFPKYFKETPKPRRGKRL